MTRDKPKDDSRPDRTAATIILSLLGALAYAASTRPTLDGVVVLLMLGALAVCALYGAVRWVLGERAIDRECTRPLGAPDLTPRYMPGSKADLKQQADDKRRGKEVA